MNLETIKLDQLNPAEYNPRTITKDEFEGLKFSLEKYGQLENLVANKDMTLIGGHQRLEAMKKLGWTEATVAIVDVDKHTEKKLNALLNSQAISGSFDDLKLAEILEELKLDDDYESLRLDKLEPLDLSDKGGEAGKLEQDFLIPPFTVFDTRQGYWQDRKRDWVSLGIKSEAGRDDELLGFSSLTSKFGNRGGAEVNTSVFDPVLCEIMYKWFGIEGGKILDPFAGGSVRGIVASYLGYKYTGLELSSTQVAENQKQANKIVPDNKPTYIFGDSNKTLDTLGGEYDLVFSCPPYYDLEVYGDGEADLSAMGTYEQFLDGYNSIIKKACDKLRPNRFAIFVITEIRDKAGIYRGFVPDTIKAFSNAGLQFYNEAILVNATGSLPLRVGRQFRNGRKLGRTHQNIIIAYKGDPKQIKTEYSQEIIFEETLKKDL